MHVVELNEYNIERYAAYLGEDMAENIGRIFFRGLVLEEDGTGDLLGGMVWELKHLDDAKFTKSCIHWFACEDYDVADALFFYYAELNDSEGVGESFVTIPFKKGSRQKQILKRKGFSVKLMEGDNVVVKLSEIVSMPVFQKRQEMNHVHPLEELSRRDYRRLIVRLEMRGQKGTCEDLGYLPMGYFEPGVSCYFEDGDTIRGLLLFHTTPSGRLSLKVMRALPKVNREISLILMQLMLYAVGYMGRTYPLHTGIEIDRHNHAALLLAEKLFPRGFGSPVYSGSRKEYETDPDMTLGQ